MPAATAIFASKRAETVDVLEIPAPNSEEYWADIDDIATALTDGKPITPMGSGHITITVNWTRTKGFDGNDHDRSGSDSTDD